jgi:hypothetical protein
VLLSRDADFAASWQQNDAEMLVRLRRTMAFNHHKALRWLQANQHLSIITPKAG